MIKRDFPHSFYLIYVPDKKQPECFFFSFFKILSHLKAYCYSLWDSRWKMPHFFLLVMVIKCLSIDPECLNLTQKYLIINIFPFLPFVSSTLEKTQKRFLGGAKLSCQFLAYITRKILRVQTSMT